MCVTAADGRQSVWTISVLLRLHFEYDYGEPWRGLISEYGL